MNFLKKIKEEENLWVRIFSALAIILIVTPPIVLSAFLGKPGIFIGLVFYVLLAFWGMFEIFKNFASKYSAVFLSSLSIVIFLISFNSFLELTQIRENVDLSLKAQLSKGINWWSVLIVSLASFIPSIWDSKIRKTNNIFLTQFFITSIVVIVSLFAKIFWIIAIDQNPNHFYFLIFLILVPILNDTFAYLGGKYLGKYIFNGAKLAPKISPKKTWAGFIIAFVVSSFFIGLSSYFFHFFEDFEQEVLIIVLLSLFLPVISTLGDLFFSLVKRFLSIKDFSNIIPGHGGIFDRLDSMTFVFVFTGLIFIFVS